MKKISAFSFLAGLILLAGCGSQPPAENGEPPVDDDQNGQQQGGMPVEVQNEYESKIVYVNPGSDTDWTPYRQDCEARDGVFTECGNGCGPDADFCAAVCTPVCELGEGETGQANEWETFTSKGIGITVQYPPAAEVEQEPAANAVSFRILGPTQTEGTEIFDGLSVTITKAPLPEEMTIREYAQEQADQDRNVGEITEEIGEITIAGMDGVSYEAETLGRFTKIFLPHGETEVISISYIAPDPTDAGYREMAEQMLESLSMHSIRKSSSTGS